MRHWGNFSEWMAHSSFSLQEGWTSINRTRRMSHTADIHTDSHITGRPKDMLCISSSGMSSEKHRGALLRAGSLVAAAEKSIGAQPHVLPWSSTISELQQCTVGVGGDLYEDLKQKGGRLEEGRTASGVLRPCIAALIYLHSKVRALCSRKQGLPGQGRQF